MATIPGTSITLIPYYVTCPPNPALIEKAENLFANQGWDYIDGEPGWFMGYAYDPVLKYDRWFLQRTDSGGPGGRGLQYSDGRLDVYCYGVISSAALWLGCQAPWEFGGHNTVFNRGRFRGLPGRPMLRSRPVSFSTVAKNGLSPVGRPVRVPCRSLLKRSSFVDRPPNETHPWSEHHAGRRDADNRDYNA
jgi:hypothetical protein